MPAPVNPPTISAIAPPVRIEPTGVAPSTGAAFHAVFAHAISKVESFQQSAHTSIDNFLSGEGEELHQVALATQKAELSFELFMQVRNKVVSAYQEVMRMQV